jgi:hypothetical protein
LLNYFYLIFFTKLFRPATAEPFVVLPTWLTEFLPTLMIWIFTAALPALVAYAEM